MVDVVDDSSEGYHSRAEGHPETQGMKPVYTYSGGPHTYTLIFIHTADTMIYDTSPEAF